MLYGVFKAPQDVALTICQWVRRTLTLEGIVFNKHRPKHNFTVRDLARVLLALWTRDDLIFIPERYRVQTTFIIHVYCWTGARIGAFFTDGLRYNVEIAISIFTVPRLTLPGHHACAAARGRSSLETDLQDRPAMGAK